MTLSLSPSGIGHDQRRDHNKQGYRHVLVAVRDIKEHPHEHDLAGTALITWLRQMHVHRPVHLPVLSSFSMHVQMHSIEGRWCDVGASSQRHAGRGACRSDVA
jgi:hypothetical protein